jgi:hypothetical protein
MATEAAVNPDKLESLKSNSFFAFFDPGGLFKEAPMGAPILFTDAAGGFLSASDSSATTSEDLLASSIIGLNFGN